MLIIQSFTLSLQNPPFVGPTILLLLVPEQMPLRLRYPTRRLNRTPTRPGTAAEPSGWPGRSWSGGQGLGAPSPTLMFSNAPTRFVRLHIFFHSSVVTSKHSKLDFEKLNFVLEITIKVPAIGFKLQPVTTTSMGFYFLLCVMHHRIVTTILVASATFVLNFSQYKKL